MSKSSKNLTLIPVVSALGFIPMIVYNHVYHIGYHVFDWFPNDTDQYGDMYLFWKMVAIIVVACVMSGIMLYQRKSRNFFQFESSFYLLLFYLIFVTMSALFSHYKKWVFAGSYELFESYFAVVAYAVICYYTYTVVRTKHQIDRIFAWSGIGVGVITLIGVFQFFGYNLYASTIGKMLITPIHQWDNLPQITSTTAKGIVTTTLYNQNYLSFYYGVMIPILICLMIAKREKKWRISCGILFAGSCLCLYGSKSLSGILALMITFILIGLIFASRKKKLLIGYGIVLTALAVIVTVLCVLTPIGAKLSYAFGGSYYLSDVCDLDGMETGDESVMLNINGNNLFVSYDYDKEAGTVSVTCTDEQGNPVTQTPVDDETMLATVDDPLYAGCILGMEQSDDRWILDVELDNKYWFFSKGEDGTYYYYNPAQKWIKVKQIESVKLIRDDAFSGRGRIWNNTIPLLKNHVFIGSGANTFALEYPQEDYIYNFYVNTPTTLDVKAHSWYLMQWVENGLPAMILFIAFYLCYLIKSIKLYRRFDMKKEMHWISLGIFSALLTYMIVALVNDSTVCTASVYWVLLGLGIAVNRSLACNGEL